MIIPCIDLMDGKVVQLIQGREKALEVQTSDEMLHKFASFSQIQVIDLDAAMGKGSNDHIVEDIASKTMARVGGGVRTLQRAQQLVDQGAFRIIVGTSAFNQGGINEAFLEQLAKCVGRERIVIALDSKAGRIVVKGWQEATALTATDVVRKLEPYCSGFLCTYVDKEGMMEGTDLKWFADLRKATQHELTAAGGITTMDDIRALTDLDIHCAVGMAIYTGRLSLDELANFQGTATQAH
jgi:phosphoribosylformimino-5-aminoimidazole carboxamide ribotide isomerase